MIELMLVAALAMPVHDTQILNCSAIKKSTKVSEQMMANGLLAERYDTNKDGEVDVVVLSSITGTGPANGGEVPHQAFGTFYLVDADYDGSPDYIYVDINGDGACESIRLYEDLNAKPSEIRPGQVGELL